MNDMVNVNDENMNADKRRMRRKRYESSHKPVWLKIEQWDKLQKIAEDEKLSIGEAAAVVIDAYWNKHLERQGIMGGSKTTVEAIQKQTPEEPQPSEEQGYQTFIIKEEILDEDVTENGNNEQLSEELEMPEDSEKEIDSGLANEDKLEDGWKEDKEAQLKHEDPQPAGLDANHADSAQKEDIDDGHSKVDGGEEYSHSSDEADYETLKFCIKEEPLDSEHTEELEYSATVGIMPHSLCEEVENSSLESSSMGSTLQISDGRSEHLSDHSPLQSALGTQSDSSERESFMSGNSNQMNSNESMRSSQEMSGDRSHDGGKHLEDFPSQGELGTRSDSSERDSFTSEYCSSHTPNCVVHAQEQSVAEKEMWEASSSHHMDGGMDRDRNRDRVEEGEMTSVLDIVQSYQPHFSMEDNRSKPMPTPKQPKPYQCSVCHKEYSHEVSLSRHMKSHTEEELHQCMICYKGFSRKSILVQHIRTHKEGNLHQCTVCGKVFSNTGNLNKHARTHSGEKPFKCRFCQKEFYHANVLSVHMRTHTGEKPYQCTICDMKFAHHSSLSRHLFTHTGVKPYECSVCGRGFLGNYELKRHMQTHTEERPYQCSICHKKFRRDNQLVVHKRTHTDEKPYKCSVCNKAYRAKYDLKKHMGKHEELNPFQCKVCPDRFSCQDDISEHMKIHTENTDVQAFCL